MFPWKRERERKTVFHDCSWSWWLQLKLIIRQVLITKISEWRFQRTWVLFNVSFSVLQTTWNIYPLMLQSLCQSLFNHCFFFALFFLIVIPLSLSLLILMQHLSICHLFVVIWVGLHTWYWLKIAIPFKCPQVHFQSITCSSIMLKCY